MHTSITKRPLLRSLFAAIVLALMAGCGSGGGSLAGASESLPESLTGPSIQCANPGPGLAAVDLSGQCRVAPQATMGALEAVSG